MAGLVPAIHVFAALDQVVDARVKPGHDESWAARGNHRKNVTAAPYSTGSAAGGGALAVAFAAAAFFSTMRTAMIEPS
jgi:hypothetical protein